jgi:hypothetical protein
MTSHILRLRPTGPQWPYSVAQLQADEPRLSVSNDPHPAELASYAELEPPILLISYSPTPQPDHDPALFKAVETMPVQVAGAWQQAWELVELPPIEPQPRWVEFGAAVQSSPAINSLLGAALQQAPALGLGLGVGLGKAADGDARVFLSSWSIARTLGLISPELLAAVEVMALGFNLPSDFVTALASDPQQLSP